MKVITLIQWSKVKTSELIQFLSQLPDDKNPEIVTGEEWLPEMLIGASYNGELVNLQFDNAPEEDSGELEGRGFVEHEVLMLRDKIVKLMFDQSIEPKTKADIFLQLFILAHEQSSAEVIELLKNPQSWSDDH
jgi:hypothetical protein